MVGMPRKRQALGKTTDPSTIKRMNENVGNSPLLALAPELLEKILKLVLGDEMIHVIASSWGPQYKLLKVCCSLCNANQPVANDAANETQPTTPPQAEQDALYYTESFEDIHKNCELSRADTDPSKVTNLGTRLHLSVLGTCRKLHKEGQYVFWSTNTFTFSETATLRVFLGKLNRAQKFQLNRVAISLVTDDVRTYMNLDHMTPIIAGLKHVQNLQLHIMYLPQWTYAIKAGEEHDFEKRSEPLRRLFNGLRGLSLLKPKQLTVKISDHPGNYPPSDWVQARLSVMEKNQLADDLLKKLGTESTAEAVKREDVKRTENIRANNIRRAPNNANASRVEVKFLQYIADRAQAEAVACENTLQQIVMDIGSLSFPMQHKDRLRAAKSAADNARAHADHELGKVLDAQEKATKRHDRAVKLNDNYREDWEDGELGKEDEKYLERLKHIHFPQEYEEYKHETPNTNFPIYHWLQTDFESAANLSSYRSMVMRLPKNFPSHALSAQYHGHGKHEHYYDEESPDSAQTEAQA